MADISTVTIPVGGSTATYNLKDSEARTLISNLQSAIEALGSPLEFLGITTTTITDGDTTHVTYNSLVGITIPAGHNPSDVIDNGSVVISGQNEYVFLKTSNAGGTWYAFGSPTVTPSEYTVLGSNATFSATSNVSWSTPDTEYFVNSDSFDMSTGGLPGADYDDYIGPLPKATLQTNVVVGEKSSGATATAIGSIITNSTSSGGVKYIDAINGGTAASWSATVTGENLAFTWTPNTVATAGTAKYLHGSDSNTFIKSGGLDIKTQSNSADTYLYWTKDTGITSTTGLSVSTSVTTNNKDQKTVYGPQTQP